MKLLKPVILLSTISFQTSLVLSDSKKSTSQRLTGISSKDLSGLVTKLSEQMKPMESSRASSLIEVQQLNQEEIEINIESIFSESNQLFNNALDNYSKNNNCFPILESLHASHDSNILRCRRSIEQVSRTEPVFKDALNKALNNCYLSARQSINSFITLKKCEEIVRKNRYKNIALDCFMIAVIGFKIILFYLVISKIYDKS